MHFGISDRNTNADRNPDTNGNTNADRNANRDTTADEHTNGYPDLYPNANIDVNALTKGFWPILKTTCTLDQNTILAGGDRK